ncbi:hypothetical protein MYCTH_2307626 [Thermothelomyces thermophilus ATCC 42464]|uniref:BHLH domain-containing protein n=1 Tax=Thermothelomyces thermophilus (strain ATCC 42464 / BCRC 31852 / DSM 1799) TaxID=573729 RepID=G2QGH4_THET4|nr:uncharacterized protein MYCTH_2307626 [Thermothelomyces thermophilus ATCC 42464]AEO59384.1 hypothetical protein MYCTH_2307626 [Thermothelomyces thermophilus ATCC 42464]
MAAGQASTKGSTKTRVPERKPRKSSASRGDAIIHTADAAVDATDSPEPPDSPVPEDDDRQTPSPRLQHARRRQNRVGKRYRDKLTACFETLQATLGVDEVEARVDGSIDGKQHGISEGRRGKTRARRRPLNKAEVLDLTCERVKTLLQEWEAVKAAREAMQTQREAEGW